MTDGIEYRLNGEIVISYVLFTVYGLAIGIIVGFLAGRWSL